MLFIFVEKCLEVLHATKEATTWQESWLTYDVVGTAEQWCTTKHEEMVVLQRLNGVENRHAVAAIMGLIQDEDGDVSIDLAAVVGMQNEIWALYISSVDLPSLGEP
ncbi:hypothetical protein FVER53590_29989 [Fusarium verticillioides]|nr:hypothetical protein FVER53590_29989 [Fusarium verticillioides]